MDLSQVFTELSKGFANLSIGNVVMIAADSERRELHTVEQQRYVVRHDARLNDGQP